MQSQSKYQQVNVCVDMCGNWKADSKTYRMMQRPKGSQDTDGEQGV